MTQHSHAESACIALHEHDRSGVGQDNRGRGLGETEDLRV